MNRRVTRSITIAYHFRHRLHSWKLHFDVLERSIRKSAFDTLFRRNDVSNSTRCNMILIAPATNVYDEKVMGFLPRPGSASFREREGSS